MLVRLMIGFSLAKSAQEVPLLLVGMMGSVPQREDLLALRRASALLRLCNSNVRAARIVGGRESR